MSTFAIGVDLGGTNLRVAAVSAEGTLLEAVTTTTRIARGRELVMAEMCVAVQELAQRQLGKLAGIGIGVPGIIDGESGTVRQSPNLPDWREYPVRAEIAKRLGRPVILENDANAAALGEKWLGAGRDFDSMAMITLGTGVGGGLVLADRLWRGMNGMAAEFGHISVAPEGPLCGCGGRGCVEQFASAPAIRRMAAEAAAGGAAPELQRALTSDPELSARAIFEMAQAGDQPAQAIFRRTGVALGLLLATLINIFNLPMIAIGGGVAGAWEAFAPEMLRELRRRSYIYAITSSENHLPREKTTMILPAKLGSQAGLYGAARLALLQGSGSAKQ